MEQIWVGMDHRVKAGGLLDEKLGGDRTSVIWLLGIIHRLREVFTLPHSFRAVLLENSHICSECSISEVRANFRNSSEFFRAYSDQFRATGRNHSDMIRTYSEQIPSKFRSYPSVLIRAIPNKDQ